jgi:hypothetical protein
MKAENQAVQQDGGDPAAQYEMTCGLKGSQRTPEAKGPSPNGAGSL